MPLRYKIPGYLGNAVLMLIGLFTFSASVGAAVFLLVLGALNLYLIYKLDQFSHEEVWLAAEVVKARLRQELAAAEDAAAEPPPAATPTPDAPRHNS
jgi:hypothetical protein